MSLTAPYEVITQILITVNPLSVPVAEHMLFINSLSNTYLTLGVINAVGIIPALLQLHRREEKQSNKAPPTVAD